MCECIIGKTECVKAQILHEVANARYRIWQSESTEERWDDYKVAQAEYRCHLGRSPDSFSVQTEGVDRGET